MTEILDFLEYRDGGLFWKVSPANAVSVGQRFGCLGKDGYRRGEFRGAHYLEHRLVFAKHYGNFRGSIDHIDGNPQNNKIENLRLCSQARNIQNSKLSLASSTGKRGVSRCGKRYRAYIWVNNKQKHLGVFATKEEAAEVANTTRKNLFNEFYRELF